MKIAVIMPVYGIGGVPLAQIRFARALARRGHDVDLLVGTVDPSLEFPEVPAVNVVKLQTRNVRTMVIPLIRYFRTTHPHVVFSAEDHLNIIVLLAAVISGTHAKVSCSSRVTAYDTYSSAVGTKRWVLKLAAYALSWRADVMTCVSSGMIPEYVDVFGSSRHVRVFNIVDAESIKRLAAEPLDHEWLGKPGPPTLVAAGQLAPWKGYDDLLRAIEIVNRRQVVRLVVLGDGPSRSALEALAAELGVADIVRFEGFVSNPQKYFSASPVFAHSAHVESLGNVLIEAMACGCTVVATDCPTGPTEVLDGGRYGYLVPMRDPEALACGIEEALAHPTSPEVLNEALMRFSESEIIAQHFRLLGMVV